MHTKAWQKLWASCRRTAQMSLLQHASIFGLANLLPHCCFLVLTRSVILPGRPAHRDTRIVMFLLSLSLNSGIWGRASNRNRNNFGGFGSTCSYAGISYRTNIPVFVLSSAIFCAEIRVTNNSRACASLEHERYGCWDRKSSRNICWYLLTQFTLCHLTLLCLSRCCFSTMLRIMPSAPFIMPPFRSCKQAMTIGHDSDFFVNHRRPAHGSYALAVSMNETMSTSRQSSPANLRGTVLLLEWLEDLMPERRGVRMQVCECRSCV